MKTILTRLLRLLLRVRRPKAPPRRLANSATSATTLVAIAPKEPIRSLRVVQFNDATMLIYALDQDRYTVTFPNNERGAVQALIAVQRWHDADCNFDAQACVEMATKINELADEACSGKGF